MAHGAHGVHGVHGFNLWGQVDVDAVALDIILLQAVGFDMLLHVVSLDESLLTVRTLVWLVSCVNLSVSV